ncbi:MAG: hypothetical protein ACLSA6_06510 [Holdemania massiliensis]
MAYGSKQEALIAAVKNMTLSATSCSNIECHQAALAFTRHAGRRWEAMRKAEAELKHYTLSGAKCGTINSQCHG